MMLSKEVKILLVDDDHLFHEYLGYHLKKEGFQVYSSFNGQEALQQAKSIKPDIILLDIMIPGMDGIEICEELRKSDNLSRTSIIILTARLEDYNQVAGFGAGADDYVTKPVKPKLLISRINALLRRNIKTDNASSPQDNLKQGLIIDNERYLILNGNNEIFLPRKEFELLSFLRSDPQKIFTRFEIFNSVWPEKKFKQGKRTIDVHIRKLRKKIGEQHIKTVKGLGYKFIE